MVRVTRPGGRVAVTDMVTDPTPSIADESNRLERLRDPRRGRTLSEAEIVQLVEAAGATIERSSAPYQTLDLEDWMARTETPTSTRNEIRQRVQHELRGGNPTGLRPSRGADGQLTFVHPCVTAVARVDAGAPYTATNHSHFRRMV
jgi:hypothetical protein